MNEAKPVSTIVIVAVAVLLALIFIGSLIISGKWPLATEPNTVSFDPILSTTRLYLEPTTNLGRVGPALQVVYGPQICTAYGDPFSPWNSIYWPGSYTYRYAIVIPPNYPHDVVRVELFDPDSINTATQTVQVMFSQTAVNHDPVRFPPTGIEMTCPSERKDHCILDTGELDIVAETDGAISVVQINPYWYVRTDANRGAGSEHGDGNCDTPATYSPQYNTQTVYELWYEQGQDGRLQPIPLAAYTGQVNDGLRDSGDHRTDMRWVSPGGTQLFDQPVPVPADFGSFEIDLNDDLPGIRVDSDTGERLLWLDITAISGASGNEFHIWAGPLYSEFASDGNIRNLQIANMPGAYDSAGVRVKAIGYLAQVSHETGWTEKPLLYIGPDYAGSTIHISAFDLDVGSQPPVIFSFDSLAFAPADNDRDGIDHDLTDWALSFGGTADPNVEGRCFAEGDGYTDNCDNQWIVPAYAITIPHDLTCDYQNPDVANCTPFYGGTLSLRYRIGSFTDYSSYDTAVWQVQPLLPVDPDPTVGCSAFPMAPEIFIRSVTPPHSDGPNPYPNVWEFSYPSNPPVYEQFVYHQPDILLHNAGPGMVYRAWLNGQNAAFLRWNTGIGGSSQLLANSLLWPGNTRDYTDHGDSGEPATPLFSHVVRGYVNPLDDMDITLGLADWVAVEAGNVNAHAVREALNTHIDRGRLLRLPVWDELAGIGSDSRVRTYRFGLFRLHGYNLAAPAWLLLEFAGWDDSCGQALPDPPPPLTAALTPTVTATPTTTATLTSTSTATTVPVTYTPTPDLIPVPELSTIHLSLPIR
jgi:hypothetical protein